MLISRQKSFQFLYSPFENSTTHITIVHKNVQQNNNAIIICYLMTFCVKSFCQGYNLHNFLDKPRPPGTVLV